MSPEAFEASDSCDDMASLSLESDIAMKKCIGSNSWLFRFADQLLSACPYLHILYSLNDQAIFRHHTNMASPVAIPYWNQLNQECSRGADPRD